MGIEITNRHCPWSGVVAKRRLDVARRPGSVVNGQDFEDLLDDLIRAVWDDCAYATRHCDNYKCRDGTQEVVWHCPRCGNVGPTTAANLELAIKEKTWPKKKNQAR